jgi:hypothetical protein
MDSCHSPSIVVSHTPDSDSRSAPLRAAEPPRESSSLHPVAIAAASDAQTRAPRIRRAAD